MKTNQRVGLALAAMTVALAGCALKEMKSTPFYEGGEVEYVGEASERVNLWPVAYWRNPVGAVAWPLVAFSDDHFAFRPIYSQYKQGGNKGAWDEFNFLWPIAQVDTKSKACRVFPVFWGKDWKDRDYQAVFPVYWNGPNYNSLFPLWYYGSGGNYWTFHTFAGFAGAHKTRNDYRCSWAFPLWYEDNTGLFTTLLYGQTRDSHWVFPLWYKGEKAFVSPLYAQGEDGGKSWWAVPLGLSWGGSNRSDKYEKDDGTILLGFGGWYRWEDTSHEYGNWWAFPFVRRNWNMPKELGRKPSCETYVAGYLSGWETVGDELKSLYVFPLFGWGDDGSWLTLLGGQLNYNSTTNTVITPLVGITSGERTGGWVAPVWSHDEDADFDEKVALIDSPTLPDCIEVIIITNDNEKSVHFGKTYPSGKCFHSADETVALLHDANHFIWGENYGWYDSPTNKYVMTERYKRGNKLLLNYESKRKVSYDLKTRSKLQDWEESDASFLVWLYQYEWNRDRTTGEEYARHRVLWRLWDWEESDGDVSLDVFPGFTYDSCQDGYVKTSFLWRLFRYERDPEAGTSVDFLFIPILR